MKKTILLTPLLLAALLLAGCVAAPPDALMRQDSAASREKLISADAAQLPMRSGLYTLYFRYGDTPYLAQEERMLTIERNTGARGLRSIIEGILTGIMFEVPSDETVTSVTITADCARGKAKPVFTHGAKKSAAKLGSGKNITA